MLEKCPEAARARTTVRSTGGVVGTERRGSAPIGGVAPPGSVVTAATRALEERTRTLGGRTHGRVQHQLTCFFVASDRRYIGTKPGLPVATMPPRSPSFSDRRGTCTNGIATGSDTERGLGVGTRTSPAHPRFCATKQQLRHDYMTRLQQDYTCEFILELTFHPLNPVALEQRRASV